MTHETSHSPSDPASLPRQDRGPAPLASGPGPASACLILALFGLLFAWNAWKRDFWDPDEPRVALVARNMIVSGDWVVPRLAGAPLLATPPLSYWVAAVGQFLPGLDPRISARLPFVIVAVGSLALTWLAGKKLFDGRIGFLAACIQASTWYYFRQASWLDDDILFAFGCQLGLTAFAIATRKGTRPVWTTAGWFGLAVAALAKSFLLALSLVFGALILFLFLEGGVGKVRSGLRRTRRPGDLLLWALLVVPWYIFVSLRSEGGAVLAPALWSGFADQHWGRLWSAGTDRRPPYFYLVDLLGSFLPWTLFLPLGFIHGKDRLRRDGERFAFVTLLFTLIALSFASSKKPGWALLAWPSLSLLISAGLFETKDWFSIWEDFLRQGVFTAVPMVLRLPALLALSAVAIHLGGYGEPLFGERYLTAVSDPRGVWPSLVLLCGAGGLCLLVSTRIRRFIAAKELTRAAFELACASLFLYFSLGFFQEGLNSFLSSKPCMDKFSAVIPAGAPVAVYGKENPAIFYYLGRHAEHLAYPDANLPNDPRLERILQFLGGPTKSYVITTRKELDLLEQLFPSTITRIEEVQAARIGWGEEYVLVGSK